MRLFLVAAIIRATIVLGKYDLSNGHLGFSEYGFEVEFLNYHHLRYFWAVAREGSLKQAAQTLRVSQPTISAQVQALEGALDVTLFRRGGRAMTLTEEGLRVFSYAEEIFAVGQELLHSLKEPSSQRPVRVQVGISDSLPKLISYRILQPVFRLVQPYQVICREGKIEDLLGQLAAFRLDVVLADEPAPSSLNIRVFNHLLGESEISFCARPDYAATLKRRFPQCLNGAAAMLPPGNSALRRSLEKYFQTHNIRPRVVAEFEDPALMKVAAREIPAFFPLATEVLKEAYEMHAFRAIGRATGCRQQSYAISAERKVSHPAVLAITERRKARPNPGRKPAL
jgi:LysR family transcriptional activator of nhaA